MLIEKIYGTRVDFTAAFNTAAIAASSLLPTSIWLFDFIFTKFLET